MGSPGLKLVWRSRKLVWVCRPVPPGVGSRLLLHPAGVRALDSYQCPVSLSSSFHLSCRENK
ncbi:hypothetical protein CDEST_04283 [Colletotrichum destructivum]|uniref:Uncharacterized protein n=1 Tax=Colletotrichum destructivum TaxID=34406 RepID=A0AAX4I8L9_9PEZI|nr:hypothetical protein CDEST_04283 [Colletotrichum destructivum]